MQDQHKYIKHVLECLNIDHSNIPEAVLETINPSYLIGMHFFRKKKLPEGKSHNEAQIDFEIKNKISIRSNFNTYYSFMKRFVKVDCPNCGEVLKGTGGGGSGSEYQVDYHCDKCGTKVSLSGNPEGGFNMNFKQE